jgi:hypothetical protein
VSFFEPIPTPGEPEEDELGWDWTAPPAGILGGVAAWQALLGRTGDVVLAAGPVEVYPTGIAFRITARLREQTLEPGRFCGMLTEDPVDPERSLRIGALYPDGRRTRELHTVDWDALGDPAHPVLWPRGGGGSDSDWRNDYWLWPAPPEGDLVLVARWLARGITETRATIPAAVLADARTRMVEVWPADG